MALKARSRDPLQLSDDLKFGITVDYYDDTDPLNAGVNAIVGPVAIIHSKTWFLGPDTTTTQLQAAVVAEGQSARAAYVKFQAAQAAVPAGTIITVP